MLTPIDGLTKNEYHELPDPDRRPTSETEGINQRSAPACDSAQRNIVLRACFFDEVLCSPVLSSPTLHKTLRILSVSQTLSLF